MISFQQTKFTEFITGQRAFSNWNSYIDEFNKIGGHQVINRMEIHLEEAIKNKKRIDNLLKRRY